MRHLTYWILVFTLFLGHRLVAQEVMQAQSIDPPLEIQCQFGSQEFKVDIQFNDDEYQWQKRKIGNTSWIDIPGEDNAKYEALNVPPPGEEYRVKIKKFLIPDPVYSDSAIFIVAAPVSEITYIGDTSICNGDTTEIKLTNAGAFTIDWAGPGNFMSDDSIVTLSSAGNYTVSYSIQGSNACDFSDDIEITESPGPDVEIEVNPQQPVNGYCIGNQVTLFTSGSPVMGWKWENGSSSPTRTFNLNDSGDQTYAVTVSDDNNCTNTATITLSVNDAPSVSILPATLELCATATNIQLSTSGGPFSIYKWDGPGGFSSTAEMPLIPSPQTGTYSVTVTDGNGCTASAVRDAVLPQGLSVFMNVSHSSICPDDTLFIKPGNAPITGYTYKWSNNATSWSIPAFVAGTYTVTITHVSSGCTVSLEKSVSEGVVDAQIIAPEISCVSGALIISASSPNVTNDWKWSWTGSGTLSDPSAQAITVSNLSVGTYTYTVTVTNSRGCTAVVSKSLEIIDKPEVSISGPVMICNNAADLDYFVNQEFDSYSWQVQGGSITSGSSTKGSAEIIWNKNVSTHWVKVTVKIGECANTVTLNVDISNEEALPPGYIFLKPSNDILIFELDKDVYPDQLTYQWGALKVLDATKDIVVPYALDTVQNNVNISDNNQYYYVGEALDSLAHQANVVFYVIISDGSGCPTYCYWPNDPFNKGGGVIPEGEEEEAMPVNPQVIPNPNSGYFKVQLPDVYNGAVSYSLCHSAGSLAKTGTTQVSSGYGDFDFSGRQFPPGLYYLTIRKPGFGMKTNLKVIIK